MSKANNELLRRICGGSSQTFETAQELLNLAVAKTGPGSGHNIGANTAALPAICAFLASQRLGNTDVSEKIAQQASCIAPKTFKATLTVVRGAIANYISERSVKTATPLSLARSYRLDEETILRWVGEVEKNLSLSRETGELDVDDATMSCVMFYWICTALHIRSVKLKDLMSAYSVNLADFEFVMQLIDKTCTGVQERIDKEVAVSRAASASPSKRDRDTTSPRKRTNDEPSPAVTPVKKQRTLAQVSETQTRSQTRSQASPTKTPLRQYGSIRSIQTLTSTTTNPASKLLSKTPTKTPNKLALATPRAAEVNECMNRLALDDEEDSEDDMPPSPSKAQTPKAGPSKLPSRPSTQTQTAVTKQTLPLDEGQNVMDLDTLVAKVDNAYEAQQRQSRCPRHHRRPFADRQFYLRRDARVVHEWEVCERNYKLL